MNYENLGWLAETLATYFISKNRLPVQRTGLGRDQQVQELEHPASQGHQEDPASLRLDHGTHGHPGLNGYKDLHGQYLVVDKGLRLGTSKTAFRQRFYRKEGPHREVPFDRAEGRDQAVDRGHHLEMSAATTTLCPT